MRYFFWVVLMLSFWGVNPVKAEQLRPQLDDMVTHFLDVVYGSEYGLSETPGVISKWLKSPVNIIIQGKPTPEMGRMASAHLNIISKLTKIKFKQDASDTTSPSLNLIFLKRSEMGNINIPGTDPKYVRALSSDPTMVCYFLAWHKPPEQIIKAIVVINNERESVSINSCLLEELTQVMGLPNDVKAYWKTLFNPFDMALYHSPWDMLYLKTLYDPRLRPGMLPAEAQIVVREIFKEALAQHTK